MRRENKKKNIEKNRYNRDGKRKNVEIEKK